MVAVIDRISTIGTGTKLSNRDVSNLSVIPILHEVLNPLNIGIDRSQVVEFTNRIAFQNLICDSNETKLGRTDA